VGLGLVNGVVVFYAARLISTQELQGFHAVRRLEELSERPRLASRCQELAAWFVVDRACTEHVFDAFPCRGMPRFLWGRVEESCRVFALEGVACDKSEDWMYTNSKLL